MSRASRPGQSRPTVVIVIAPDERSAEIVIEGRSQVVIGQVPKETRRAALDAATGYAARIGQPVLVDARDANGFWRLVATPDGVVRAADRAGSGRTPAPQASPPPQGKGGEGAQGGRRGRTLVIAGAAALALTLIIGAGALALRYLPVGSFASESEEENANTAELAEPAPPGFSQTVVFSEDLAPGSEPGVSRDGDLLAFVDPGQRLTLFSDAGEELWAADLPVDPSEVLGAPRFVGYGGETAVVMETPEALWFWPTGGGDPSSVELPDGAAAQYVGDTVLVRTERESFVPVDGELEDVELPEGSAPMLADGERVLGAVLNGPWEWVDTDGESTVVNARRPEEAGEMEAVMTALREYVIIRWEPLQGEGTYLAFHDREDGSVIGGAEVDPADLEGIRHRSGPVGTDLVGYGPVLMDPETGETAVLSGFEPEIAVGDQVFGRLGGNPVAVDAGGEATEAPDGSEQPRGLLGGAAIVVHDDHLYAISPQ